MLERGSARGQNDLCTGELVALQALDFSGLGSLQQGDTTTRDDAFLNGGLSVTHCILNAVLALLEFNLGSSAHLDDSNAASELGEALLQLLAVVVGVGVLDLLTDLRNTAGDLLGIPGTVDNGGLVLGDDNLTSAPQQVQGHSVKGQTNFFGDNLATSQDGNVIEHRLATIAKAWSLDGDRLEGPANLVDDETSQGLTLDVLGNNKQRLARLHNLLKDRQEILQR